MNLCPDPSAIPLNEIKLSGKLKAGKLRPSSVMASSSNVKIQVPVALSCSMIGDVIATYEMVDLERG